MTKPSSDDGIIMYRLLEDGRMLAVVPLLFGRLSITLGPGGEDYDGGFDEAWDFSDMDAAFVAFYDWNPAETREPLGWDRHNPSGRRHGEVENVEREHEETHT